MYFFNGNITTLLNPINYLIINPIITFLILLLPLMVLITIINKTVNRVKRVMSNSIIKKK